MVDRASPTQQRKALDIANLFVRAGVGFVPMPVADAAEFDKLADEAMDKLAALEAASDSSPVGAERKAP